MTDTLTTSEDYEVFFSIKIPEQTSEDACEPDTAGAEVFHPVFGKCVKDGTNKRADLKIKARSTLQRMGLVEITQEETGVS